MFYEVVALEKFVVRTTYQVEADTPSAAETLVRSGQVAYDRHEIEDEPGEFDRVVSIDEISPEAFGRCAS